MITDWAIVHFSKVPRHNSEKVHRVLTAAGYQMKSPLGRLLLSLIKAYCLDEAELKRLMMQVTFKVPGFTSQARVWMLPHMMPGSRMRKMVNMEHSIYPMKLDLAITGLGSGI
ncbi:hypothetical protein GGI35DRAFT_239932 [Trichoderma velutinum]